MSENKLVNKKCNKCGDDLIIGVNWSNGRKNNYYYMCNKCFYSKYSDLIQKHNREYRENNKEKYKEYQRNWRNNNREKYNKMIRRYRSKQTKLFQQEVSQEDKQYIKECMINTDELYNKVMKKINENE